MSAMDGLAMAGHAGAHAAWIPATGAASAFLGMWIAMTAVMMLPSAIPMLVRYRASVCCAGRSRRGGLTLVAGAGYLFVWTAIGAAVFPFVVGWSALVTIAPGVERFAPFAAGLAVVVAGAHQLSARKARHLACCRAALAPGHARRDGPGGAWRHGVRLGVDCARCCGNLMAISMLLGAMDLRAMVVAGIVIAAERRAPAGERVARGVGALVAGAGLVLAARAVGGG